jgi:fatty acid desaturase
MVTSYPTDVQAPPARRGSDFAGLCRQIRGEDLLARQYGHYARRIGVTALAFAGAWTAFAVIGDSWYQMLIAVVLGLLFTQLAFIGHDGGHQQILKSKQGNEVIGLIVGTLFVGISFGWWQDKHNRHHANPNHETHDPDIADGVLAFTQAQVASHTGVISRFVAKNQAWLFFPLLTFEGFQLHVAGVQSLLGGRGRRFFRTEAALFTLHFVLYLGAVFLVLSPVKAVAFIVIHQAVFGVYMGCSFAPNHKGMAVIKPGERVDFLRRQVLTSRNVRGNWFNDNLLGGLNYQIEHHLFPNMPRPSLPRAQRLVRQYCEDHDIVYTETSLVGSYAAALGYLHELGAPLRTPTAANVAADNTGSTQ